MTAAATPVCTIIVHAKDRPDAWLPHEQQRMTRAKISAALRDGRAVTVEDDASGVRMKAVPEHGALIIEHWTWQINDAFTRFELKRYYIGDVATRRIVWPVRTAAQVLWRFALQGELTHLQRESVIDTIVDDDDDGEILLWPEPIEEPAPGKPDSGDDDGGGLNELDFEGKY